MTQNTILKIQCSMDRTRVLIYNEGKTLQHETSMSKAFDDLLLRRNKLYAYGFVDRKGVIHITKLAPAQDW